MPLGERGSGDRSDSRYCGVETDFDDDMPQVLSHNLSSAGFDFVVASLVRSFPVPTIFFGILTTLKFLIVGLFIFRPIRCR